MSDEIHWSPYIRPYSSPIWFANRSMPQTLFRRTAELSPPEALNMSEELNKDEAASEADAGQTRNEEMRTQELDKVSAGSTVKQNSTTQQTTPILFPDKE